MAHSDWRVKLRKFLLHSLQLQQRVILVILLWYIYIFLSVFRTSLILRREKRRGKNMASEAAVGFVIESLKLVTEEVKFLAGVSEEVEELQRELQRLQSFLRDAQARRNEKRDIQVWITESKDLAYEAEDLLEEYAFRISSQRKNLFKRMRFCFLNECYVHQSIGSKIQKLKTRISNTTRSFQDYGITLFLNGREDFVSSSQQQLRRTYSHIANDDFIKLDNGVEMLVGHLMNENDDDIHKIVSISGMGGLGKTTLARKVYNHPKIQGHFDNLAWVYISQHWEKNEILRGILVKFFDEKREEIVKWRDEKLMRELSQTFGNKKCLVVLDDIWSTEAWESIREAFPLKKNRSKILLTTRNRNVAQHIGPNGFDYEPRLLNDMESWELLQIKAMGEEPQIVDEHMYERKELGKEMAKYCGGLPLAVVVLGGVLARKRGIEEWNIVHKNVKAHIGRGKDIMEEQGEVKKILALSYDDLPLKLKPCFLYLGTYPEDSKIDAERLYQLWIAEGMISEKDQIGDESMMDVAERYLRELAERSLVQVEVNEDMVMMTRFKCCRLHDLIRDLSLEKAKEENFFSLVYSRNGFNEQVYKSSSPTNQIHRLVVYLEKEENVSKYFPQQKKNTKHLRSLRLVFDNGDYEWPMTRRIYSRISQFQMLRSLEIIGLQLPKGNIFGQCCLGAIDYHKLSEGIGTLIHLRYLSLCGSPFFSLPSSFGNLKQLQTLDLQGLYDSHIPNIFRKMTQLKHLYLPRLPFQTFACPKLRIDGLNKLELLEGFDSRCCCLEDLLKLTNLRWLKARLAFEDNNLLQALMLLLDSKSSVKIDMDITIHDNDRVCTVEERTKVFRKLFSCGKLLNLYIYIPNVSLPKYEVGLASHLIHLALRESKLEDDPMETLGKLPNLKKLKLHWDSFLGTEMNCNSASFLQLRTLELWYLPNLKELIIDEGAMPNLSLLQIMACKKLEMIPDGLRFIKNLLTLDVRWMTEKFNRRIKVINGQEGEDFYKIRHVPSIKVWE